MWAGHNRTAVYYPSIGLEGPRTNMNTFSQDTWAPSRDLTQSSEHDTGVYLLESIHAYLTPGYVG